MTDNGDPSRPAFSAITRRTSISRWIVSRLAVTLTALGLLSSGLSVALLDHYFDRFDESSFHEELERVGVAFALERATMSATILDYAYWDDAERFVQGKAPDFLDNNFTPASLRNLGYSAFAFATLNGQIVASRMLSAREQMAPMPAEVREKLQAIVAGFPSNGIADPAVSMFWVDNQAYLVAYAPVTDSTRKHDASGYVFFLRALDADYLDRLRRITSSRFTLIEAANGQGPAQGATEYWRDGEERFEASMPLPGLPARVIVDGATRMADERAASYAIPALNIVFMVLASLGGIYLILHRRVLKRLRLFSRLSDRYRCEGDLQIRWPVSGYDELDRLGASLNDLMARVENQHGDLRHRVEHDHLTGIGNRLLLLDRLTRLTAPSEHAQRIEGRTASLLLIDLDGFKEINDRLGHAAGDEVLRVVSRRLRQLVRDYDAVARMGGDEFAVLLRNVVARDCSPFAERLIALVEQPVDVGDVQVRVGCSVGIAPVSTRVSPAETLHNADLAMYEAKRQGRGRYVHFDLTQTWSRPAGDTPNPADLVGAEAQQATPERS